MESQRSALGILATGLLVLGVLTSTGTHRLLAQNAQQPPSPSGAYTEHELFVTVVDADGLPVRDLRTEDFVVVEDGARRELLQAALATDPMEIAILVDSSEAARPIMRNVQEGLEDFIDSLQDGHRVALMTFGGARFVMADWTTDFERVKEGVSKLRGIHGTGTYLPDAVIDTAQEFAEREAVRPVLLVISADGVDFGAHQDYRNVVRELRESYTLMYTVFIPTIVPEMGLRWDSRERDALLGQGPRQTGGRRLDLSTSLGVRGALREIHNELRSQYVVTYVRPGSLIPPERIQVGVARANLTVRRTPRMPQ